MNQTLCRRERILSFPRLAEGFCSSVLLLFICFHTQKLFHVSSREHNLRLGEPPSYDTARAPINIYEYIIFSVPRLEGNHASIFIHTSIVITLLVSPINCCHVTFLQTMNTLNVYVSHELRQHFYHTVISSWVDLFGAMEEMVALQPCETVIWLETKTKRQKKHFLVDMLMKFSVARVMVNLGAVS